MIRLTSPNLNYLIILGAMMMSASVYFYTFPAFDTDVLYGMCIVSKRSSAFLCLGNLRSKWGKMSLSLNCYKETFMSKCMIVPCEWYHPFIFTCFVSFYAIVPPLIIVGAGLPATCWIHFVFWYCLCQNVEGVSYLP